MFKKICLVILFCFWGMQTFAKDSLSLTLDRYTHDKKTKFWINYFTKNNPARFERFMKNGERYKDLISTIFAKNGMPQDLFYLGLIESGYYLLNRSHASAVGPWQFIQGTARLYGLKVNAYYDERRSVYKSTEAAARYLKRLYKMFGAWELAFAAYNSGEGRVMRAIKAGGTKDYETLCRMRLLPKETRFYVSKVAAARIIERNPELYGMNTQIPDEVWSTRVKSYKISSTTTLNHLAKKMNVEADTLVKFNPEIKTDRIFASRAQHFRFFLPTQITKNNTAERNIASEEKKPVPEKKVKLKGPQGHLRYKVRSGDSLFSIAKKFRTRPSDLVVINDLKNEKIYRHQYLYVPL